MAKKLTLIKTLILFNTSNNIDKKELETVTIISDSGVEKRYSNGERLLES